MLKYGEAKGKRDRRVPKVPKESLATINQNGAVSSFDPFFHPGSESVTDGDGQAEWPDQSLVSISHVSEA